MRAAPFVMRLAEISRAWKSRKASEKVLCARSRLITEASKVRSSSAETELREMPMPAASFLTPESQLWNFDGSWQDAAMAAADEAMRRDAERQRVASFTV